VAGRIGGGAVSKFNGWLLFITCFVWALNLAIGISRCEDDISTLQQRIDELQQRLDELQQQQIDSIEPVVHVYEYTFERTAACPAFIDSNSQICGTVPVEYTDDDLYWLAKIVYAEAGYDTDEGQKAVATVVLNRVDSPDFPDNIYDVIWQKTGSVWQFSPCGDGGIDKEPDERAYDNARAVLEGERTLPGDVLYFYMPTPGNQGDWIRGREIVEKVGVHRFCK
jgi:spore germination cell wall hydrolase CwlJ-like protein